MFWLDSRAWPAKNDTKADTSVTTKATTANTRALAHSTGSRVAAAERLARIMPVLYSPVTISTPSTPMTSWVRKYPRRLVAVGSKAARSAGVICGPGVGGRVGWEAARSAGVICGQRFAVTAANRQPNPIIATTVATRV